MPKPFHVSAVFALCLLAACTATAQSDSNHQQGHDDDQNDVAVFRPFITSEVTPWTNKPFNNDPGNFQFAIVSDLTGKERTPRRPVLPLSLSRCVVPGDVY
jgi:ABC-type phosphate/phosphonate transport system substrate-binding protein